MSAALPAFDYQRLDAFKVARETLRLGDALARRLPRGYATLQDQLRRALLSAYLGIAEASSRQGADRLCRFRCARGEACEPAAALEGVLVLNLAPEAEILTLLALLDRLCAMLTRLATWANDLSGQRLSASVSGRVSGSDQRMRPAWAAWVSVSGPRPALRPPAKTPTNSLTPSPTRPATRGRPCGARNYPTSSS